MVGRRPSKNICFLHNRKPTSCWTASWGRFARLHRPPSLFYAEFLHKRRRISLYIVTSQDNHRVPQANSCMVAPSHLQLARTLYFYLTHSEALAAQFIRVGDNSAVSSCLLVDEASSHQSRVQEVSNWRHFRKAILCLDFIDLIIRKWIIVNTILFGEN